MKKIYTIFMTLLLMPYCTTWSMLVKPSRQSTRITQPRNSAKPIKLPEHLTYLSEEKINSIVERLRTNTISMPEIIAQDSKTIQNLLKTVPNTDLTQLPLPNFTQKTVNELEQFYINPSTPLGSKPVEEIVQMINLATSLDMKKPEAYQTDPQEVLQKNLLTKIKNEKLTKLLPINNLNPDIAKELISNFIKEEKIDAKLLEPYQATLPSKHIALLSPFLRSFNNDMFAYTAYEDLKRKDKITLQKPNGEVFLINFNRLDIRHIYASPNLSFLLADSRSELPRCFNMATKEFTDLTNVLKTYCFASDDTACILRETINTESAPIQQNIELLNLTDNTSIVLASNILNTPEKAICKLNKEHPNKTVVVGVNHKENTIIMIKDNQEYSINKIYDQTNQTESRFYTIKDILIDHNSQVVYIINETNVETAACNSAGVCSNITQLCAINLTTENPTASLLTTLPHNYIFEKFIYTDNQLLMISCKNIDSRSSALFNIIPSTLNSWCQDISDSLYSNNGKQRAETADTKIGNILTINDENITEALDYLNTTKPDSSSTAAHTKLLVTKLISHILNNNILKNIMLDETESDIYNNNMPQAIKDILNKTYTIIPRSLRNKILYGTAAAGTALGLTAAYKWFMGNKK